MKEFLTRKNLTLFLLNLIPLYGALYLGWRPMMIIMLYVAETIMIGIIHVFYMLGLYLMNHNNPDAINVKRDNEGVKGGCVIPFFFVHFGFFVFVQMMVFGGFTNNNSGGVWKMMMELFTGSYKYALAALFITKVGAIVAEFLWDPEVKLKLPDDVFFQPYGRIFVQQLMVILGGWFTIFGDKKFIGYLIVLVISKTFFEILFSNPEFLKRLAKKNAPNSE